MSSDESSIYSGNFKNDMKHGYGILKLSNGEKHIGSWSNDKKHGFGFFTDKLGNIRNGEWVDNVRIRWIE